ncbi:transcriptional regulator [Natronococcus pandeyae]|uniref:Transcriptional regulator n=1 Tax=Natronococcus pandeyae TaxID=2055836 RepID=A0A8J8Q5D6_9EURY|nr:transcriptional regulator [Natronococcus pandeyae]TYL39102.1 transcriptional regulator [Natronococcus pandeyae]
MTEQPTGTRHILDELLRYELELGGVRDQPERRDSYPDTDEMIDVIRHGPLLRALLAEPLDRRDIESTLEVSKATSHRFVRWLEAQGYGERVDSRYRLTGLGETVAHGVSKFETYLQTVHRLDPLFDYICEDHDEFVVEPFADATVTVAMPEEPYAPVTRFLELLRESERFRGFNTTHMIPPGLDATADGLLESRSAELIYRPDAVETLREDRETTLDDAIDEGNVAIRTRDALPYGLALFDERIGVGGYDEETGTMRVFVDTETAIAREWATRVFEEIRADSESLAP